MQTSTGADGSVAGDGTADEAATLGRQVAVPATVALVVFTAVSIAVGFLVTRGLGGSIADADLEIARDLSENRTSGLTSLTGLATFLADSATVAVLWVAAVAVARWRTGGWRLSAFILTAIGGEKLTYLFTGIVVGRARPPVESIGDVFSTKSFPSGHVGSAIVLYGSVAVALLWYRSARSGEPSAVATRVALGLPVVAVTALVGFSRLYRGHHYVSDVVWGIVLGVVWLWLAWRLALRSSVEQDERGA